MNVWSSTYQTNLRTLCTAQKRYVRTLFATAQQPHSREIFINHKILPLDKLINQQEGILAYKVINGTYLLNNFLIMEMLGIKSNLEILVTWGCHYIQQHNLNFLFTIEQSICGMAYRVTWAARHRSVLSRINYDSCICLSHSFQIHIVKCDY